MATKTDYETAIRDPASLYHSPAEVLRDKSLNTEQKLAVLESWEQDEREMDVAQEEGMTGEEKSMLHDILEAMEKLDMTGETRDAPTKQGGHVSRHK